MYIDIHAHIYEPFFKDILATLKKAEQAGVKIIVVNGVNHATNKRILELAKQFKIIKPALGIYPTEAVEQKYLTNQDAPYEGINVDKEIQHIKKKKDQIVALGEVGLDYKEITEKQQQQEAFRKIIRLAKQIDKPLIIHSRKAEEDVITLLEQEQAKKVIMHCFSGKKALIKKIKDNGWCCSIPTSVTRSQQFQEMVGIMPLQQLFCETDSPFLSPHKETTNEPAYVIESYKKIAEIKKITLEETKNLIFQNWQRMFL